MKDVELQSAEGVGGVVSRHDELLSTEQDVEAIACFFLGLFLRKKTLAKIFSTNRLMLKRVCC